MEKFNGRRAILTGLGGLGVLLLGSSANAQAKPAQVPSPPTKPKAPAHGAMKDAPAATPISPALKAIVESTADCERDGRVCLARCTDHLAAGVRKMEQCQRAVMNMLAVSTAMADVAGFRNADSKNIKALAAACAAFCRACAEACEAHAAHHEECKACMDSCLACAKACEAYAA
jgi:Cys-rich four helix bundle protein (predicted Tat secretion target)